MAFIGNHIDPNAQPGEDYSAVPSGEYPAVIIESEMKPTAKNDGEYLELTYKITSGPLEHRQVWARLNLVNRNVKTVAIANEHLASISQACGLAAMPTDSMQLHNIPHIIRVEFVPAGTTRRNGTKTEKDGNEIRAWKALEGGPPAQGAAGGTPFAGQKPAAAPAGPAAAPSWAGNK